VDIYCSVFITNIGITDTLASFTGISLRNIITFNRLTSSNSITNNISGNCYYFFIISDIILFNPCAQNR